MSASESDSLADSVPSGGCDAAPELEFELMNRAEECAALIDSHSVRPPLFLLAWEFRPPMMDEGSPGGELFCWVISEILSATDSLNWDMSDFTIRDPSSCNSFFQLLELSALPDPRFLLLLRLAFLRSEKSVCFCCWVKKRKSEPSNLKVWWHHIFFSFFKVICLASG